MWMRQLNRVKLCLLVGPLLINSRHCTDAWVMSLDYESCVLAKSHKHLYLPSFSRSTSLFSLIHSHVWGPSPISTTYNFSYYVLFVDDCTHMSWVYLLKQKSFSFCHRL